MATPPADLRSDSPRNAWRSETPGSAGWRRSVRPGDPDKLFVVSADCHVVEPADYLAGIEPEYRERIPRLEVHEDGSQWLISEGNRPQRVKSSRKAAERDGGTGSRMEPDDLRRNATGRTVAERLADQAADGVDVEILFPNKGLLCWATPDAVFAMAMCRQWNRWVHGFCGQHMQGERPRMLPMACIAAGDVEGAEREVAWAAAHGFRGLCFGNSVIYGPKRYGQLEYNDPRFERLWSLVEEAGLAVTFHVSTGRDPRAVGGNGGAVVNYVCHSMETTLEPLVQMIASGVFVRHPRLSAGLVESGIGFVPWLLETMDYAHRAHHFWVRPTLPEPPSAYFRRHCFATFQEDHVGLRLAEELGLVDNLMWANDYPHHEGSWPHSAAAIERTMSHLSEASRAKILGGNAARVFGLDPARYAA
jgi:predicted TIM-barrel fold metal-dependent hydrolase